MPLVHRYQCLNTLCPEPESKMHVKNQFRAFNNNPVCPRCSGYKVHDMGYEAGAVPGPIFAAPYVSSGTGKSVDATLRQQADQYGLTNMDNRDGKPIKGSTQNPHGYETKNYFGIDVPIGPNITTVSGASNLKSSMKVTPQGKLPGNRSIPTQTVAEHR